MKNVRASGAVHMSVVPTTQEAETGGSHECRSLGL